ncbi:MAG: flagellar hook-associated protein FlgK [Azospirillaceae bacterium]
MSLISALNTALTGMQASQRAADLVSRNVANAGTEGYTKKTLPREARVLDGQGAGVVTGEIQRSIDLRVQAQMWTEQSSSARFEVVDDFLQRLDRLFGKPDQDLSIASSVGRLAEAFQELADEPQNATARQSVISTADQLAQDLNRMTDEVQAMRQQAEDGIAGSVRTVNEALTAVHQLNGKIEQKLAANESTAELEDQRDRHIATLNEHLDIRTFRRSGDKIAIFTPAGRPLVDATPRQLSFDARTQIGPQDTADGDPPGVGTVTLVGPEGRIDLLKEGGMASGKMLGYAQIRDDYMATAQSQLDELAHGLALALSERVGTLSSTVTASAPVNGTNPVASADLTGAASPGDTITATLSIAGPVTLTAIDPANAPPAAGEFVADPDPEVRAENIRAALQSAVDAAAGAGEFTVSVVETVNGVRIAIDDANIGANDDLTALDTTFVALDGAALPDGLQASRAAVDVAAVTTPGDTVMVRYRDGGGQVRSIELTAVADPDGGPVPEDSFVIGATPADTATNIRNEINARLSAFSGDAGTLAVDMTGPGATELRIDDSAPGAGAAIVSLHAVSRTAGTVPGEETQFAVFADGLSGSQKAYVGTEPLQPGDPPAQKEGFAGRISVSDRLRRDDTLLVAYPTPPNGTPTGEAAIGDPSRPLELLSRLTETPRQFDPATGIGSPDAPYAGSVREFATSVVSFQAVQTAEVSDRKEYQASVTETIELRFDRSAGVNVDKEMADLLVIENLYATSARVLSTVQSMLDELANLGR